MRTWERETRLIKNLQIGGCAFTIPAIVDALGALGFLGGGAAAMGKAINDAKPHHSYTY